MANQYIRPIGKPVVEKSTNGLRKITRRYVVHGPSSAEPLVESRVFEPFCTPDEEYQNALLVQQKLEGSQDASQDVLVRVYLEVNNAPAEIDPPDYVRDGVGRVKVNKSFIIKNPYPQAWSEARVGSYKWITPNGDETILAKVSFDEKTCYSEYKEEYFQIGIISFKEEVKHNGKLKIRQYRSIGLETVAEFLAEANLGADWVLVESMSGAGSTDYQYGGLEVKTWTVVNGAGRIVLEQEDKGAAQITTEVIIVADDEPYAPYSTIPPNQVFETKVEDKQGYDLWTIRGVVGQGEIDRKHEVRYNGALEIITIKNIGQQSVPPAGFVRVSESHDQSGRYDIFTDVYVKGMGLVSEEEEDKGTAQITTQVWITPNGGIPPHTIPPNQIFEEKVEEKDGYEIHTIRGVVGTGEIERREETKHNGALSIITIKNIGAQSTPPAGYVRISENFDQSGRFDIFTDVYVRGSGLISSDEEDKGTAQITTEVHITPNGVAPVSNIPPSQVFQTRVEEKDGYEIHTIRGVIGSGEIERSEETKYNGALSIIRIKNIGQQSPIPAGYERISQKHDQSGNFDIFSDVYVKGAGLISSSEEDKGTAQITTEVHITPNGGAPNSNIPPNQVFSEKVVERDGYDEHTISGVVGQGEISRKEETKHNGALSIITIKNIGQQSPVPAGYVRVSEALDQSGQFDIFTDVYAKGSGLISRSSEDKGTASITTEVWITADGQPPIHGIPANEVFKEEVSEKDGYEIHTISGVVGQGEISRKEDIKHNGALSIVTIKNIGGQSPIPAGYVRISESLDQSGQFDIYTDVYAKGSGQISAITEDKGTAQITTEVHITADGQQPAHGIPANNIFEQRVEERDGYEIHTIRGVVGAGEIDRKLDIRYNGALEILTIKNIGNQSPVPAGFVRISEKLDQSGQFDIYTDVYAKGAGLISKTSEEKGQANLTTEVWITENGGNPNIGIPQGQRFRETVEEKDGYEIHTVLGVTGQGEIDRKLETRKQGALQILTIQSIGAPAPNQAGFTRISERSDKNGNFEVFTDVFAKGAGRIQTSTQAGTNDTVRTTITYLMADDEPAPAGCVTAEDIEDQDGYVLYKKTYTKSANIADLVTSTRTDQYGIFYPTVSKTGNVPPNFPNSVAITAKRETRHTCLDGGAAVTEYEYTFAVLPANLIVSKSARQSGSLKITDITAINNMPPQGGCITAESEKSLYDVNGAVFATILSKTFAEGVGVVNESVSTSNGLTRRRKKTVGAPPVGGCVVAKNEEKVFDINGGVCDTMYDYTFLEAPAGEIEKSVSSNNGLTRTRIKTAGAPPAANGCVVAQSTEDYNDVDGALCFTVYDYTFLEGAGELERSVSSSGGVTKTRIKQFGNVPQGNGCVVAKSEEVIKDINGGNCETIYDYTFADGTGEISRTVSSSGGVTKTRVKSIGAAPVGNGCLVGKSEEEVFGVDGACYTIYDYTFASGSGEISRSVSSSGGVTKTRIRSIGAAPQGQGCLVAKSEEEEQGIDGACFTIYDYTYAEGDGEISRSTTSSGGITRTTIKTIGNAPQGNGCLVAKAEEEVKGVDGVCYTVYNYTFADGSGVLEESTSTSGGITKTRQKTIGQAPQGNGCVIAKSEETIKGIDGVCFTIYDYTFADGQGELEKTVTSSAGMTRTRIKNLGAAPQGNGCLVSKREETTKDVNGADCLILYDYEFLEAGTGEMERTTRTSGGLTVTRIKQMGGAPQGNGCVTSKAEEEIKDINGQVCTTIFTYEFTSGNGELERSSRTSDGITFVTVKAFGNAPQLGTCVTQKSTDIVYDVFGLACNKIETRTFMMWQKGVLSKSSKTGPDNMVITTVVSTDQGAGAPAGACIMGEGTKEFYDIDGKVCFTRYTTEYGTAPANGEIERTVRSGGGKSITTIKAIGNAPLAPAGACQTGSSERTINDLDGNPCFTIYTAEFTQGTGLIDQSATTRSDGGIEFTTRSMGQPPQAPTDDACPLAMAEEAVYDKDGVQCDTIYTYKWLVPPSGHIISENSVTNSNGVTVTTIVCANCMPLPPAGGGCVTGEAEKQVNDMNGNMCYGIYTREYSSSQSAVLRESVRNSGGLSYRTIKSVGNAPPAGNGGCLTAKSEVQHRDKEGTVCYTVYEYEFLENTTYRVIDQSVSLGNGTKKTTTKTLAAPYQGAGCKVGEGSSDIRGVNGVCATIYTTEHIEGTGEYDRDVSPRTGYSIVTIKSIGQAPQPPNRNRCLLSSSEVDVHGLDGTCFKKYVYQYIIADYGKKLSETSRWSDGVLYTTIRQMDQPAAGQGCKISESTEEILGENGVCIKIYETTYARGTGEVDRDIVVRNGITFTTIKSIGQPPVGDGCLWSKAETTRKGMDGSSCYTIYKYTFAKGYGEVNKTERTDGCGITYTTIESIDQPPAGAGKLVSASTSQESGGEGPCFTRYKYTYVDTSGADVILDSTQYRIDGSVVYTQTQYNNPPAAVGQCTMETRSKCDDTGTLYTTVSYDPPSGFTTRATANYFKRGKIELNSDGVVVVTESPVEQLVMATVDVQFSMGPPAANIQENDHAPILERTVTTHGGAVINHHRQYKGFCAEPDEVEREDVLFQGAPVAVVHSKLYGGNCSGDASVIKVVSDRVVKLGSCEFFRNEVWTKE